MSISITATTSETSVSASSTATTVTVSDPTISLSETVSLTGFSAGNLLDLSGSTFNVDLSELTDMTDSVVGGTDELVLLDNGTQRRKLFSEVGLSSFNNDLTSIGTLSQASFEIVSTDAGADHGPSLSLYRNSSSPANADELGSIEFYGENDADEKHLYAQIYAEATLVADGGEQGHINFCVAKAAGSGALEDPTIRLRHYALEIASNNTLDLGTNSFIKFEGSSANAHETSLDCVNPTQDNTVLIPNTSGTLVNNVSGVINESVTLMELNSTDAGAGELPVLSLYRNSSSPADNDEMGSIRFFGNNDRALSSGGPQKAFYAGIYCEAPKVDESGAHKGKLMFHLADGSGGTVGITDSTADVSGGKDPVMTLTSSLLTLKECSLFLDEDKTIQFEGANSNGHETTLTVVDPTADNTVSLPDATGTLAIIDSNDTLEITSTDAGATVDPILSLYRNSSSPAVSDDIGAIQFYGNDDGGNKTLYAQIHGFIEDETNSGSHEDGQIHFSCASGGSLEDPTLTLTRSALKLRSSNDLILESASNIRFEGDTNDSDRTTLYCVDPTATNTVLLPDASGTLVHIAENGGLQHPVLSSDPSSPANGQTYYNSSTHKLRLYANGAFVDLN